MRLALLCIVLFTAACQETSLGAGVYANSNGVSVSPTVRTNVGGAHVTVRP